MNNFKWVKSSCDDEYFKNIITFLEQSDKPKYGFKKFSKKKP